MTKGQSGYEGEGPEWLSKTKNENDIIEVNNETMLAMGALVCAIILMASVAFLYFYFSDRRIDVFAIKETIKYVIFTFIVIFCFSAVYSNLFEKEKNIEGGKEIEEVV